jgi:DNA-binding transcriptional LysR family regulator
MYWTDLKFDWNHARAFLATVEEGSLSAASRALGVAQPTLGRQVNALQEELGVTLFERVGKGLELTPAGLELVDHVRAMSAAARQFSVAAAGQSQRLDGTVCVSASEVFATYQLPPILARLNKAYPGIKIVLHASDQSADLLRREADIAIRSFRPTEPGLVARRVRDVSTYLYAHRDYVQNLPQPVTEHSLQQADFIGFDQSDTYINALKTLGLTLTQDNFRLVCGNQAIGWAMVKAGLGIGIMPAAIADRDSDMVRVLPTLPPFVTSLWLVAHREVNTSKRVRAVFDFLAQELASL